MVEVETLPLVLIFLRMAWVGHESCTESTIESSLKMTAVDSGPKPKRPTYLLFDFELVPLRFVRL